MTSLLSHLAAVVFAVAALAASPLAAGAQDGAPEETRPSILAGSWYPGSPDALEKSVERFLSGPAVPPPAGTLKAIVVPHAGHRYSGAIAARAYGLLRGTGFTRVVVVGPSHRVGFAGVSVNLMKGYRTPLGTVPVDLAAARRLMAASPLIRWVRDAHEQEHSIEIQLPFLQTVLPEGFHLVPVIMGSQDMRTCAVLADALAGVVGDDPHTLIVASSDLSHFHSYEKAGELDRRFVAMLAENRPEDLARALAGGDCEACGGGPVISVMLAARRLGADRVAVLGYANSGDVTGDRRRVVGYCSAALLTGTK